jgi:DMSO/TMAO reductase YedYZ molybdopterin-dependent catalytic subunit
MPIISRGFRGRRREQNDRLPPGQYLVRDWPVLSAGPTPHTALDQWTFTVRGAVDSERTWSWDEFNALPKEDVTKDIHCVTKWSKLDMQWEGVSLDVLLDGVDLGGRFLLAFCDGGYTTNLEIEDATGGKAWVAIAAEGQPLAAEHGAPARLLVPHLYFWKSAKWVRGIDVRRDDEPGFWESLGYHNRGDPWREQRYQGD